MSNPPSFGAIDAQAATSSYQDGVTIPGYSVVATKQSGHPKRFRHGILLACMSGVALSAFIYAVPSKTVAVADSDETDSAPLPVDVFEVADTSTLHHAPSPMPTEWQQHGEFCGSTLDANSGTYDYELVNGAFDYNVTYYGNKCLAQSTDDTNDILSCGVDYLNVEVNVTFLMGQQSDFEISAVGLRATSNDDAPTSGFCKGMEQYLCIPYVKKNQDDDGEDLIKLKMQQCAVKGTTGYVDEVMQTERTTFDYNRWYTTSFSAVGSTLECKLYDDHGALMLSLQAGADDYYSVIETTGDVTFGGYGRHFYFSDISIEELCETSDTSTKC